MDEKQFFDKLRTACEEQGYEKGLALLKESGISYAACTVNVLFEDVLAGLWQTQILKKRVLRLVETGLLAAITVMYLVSYLRNLSYTMGLVLAIICLVILAAIWIVPHLEARATASTYAANTKCFSICMSEYGIFADNEGLCTFFPIDDDMLVYETKKYFNLMIENRRLYVVPKSSLSEEDIRYLTGLFSSKVEGFKHVGL